MLKPVAVTALPECKLRVEYADGVTGEVDLSHLVGKGLFAAWNDPTAFEAVSVGAHGRRASRAVPSRRTTGFSKDWDIHEAVTYFTMYTYNFCCLVRTLRQRDSDNRWPPQTPALAAGLTDHVWSLREWLTLPAVRRE